MLIIKTGINDLVITIKRMEIKEIQDEINDLVSAPSLPLFHVEKQVEIDGIEMGVLANGMPYLSERGLARMCGVNSSNISRLAASWQEEKLRPRGAKINDILLQAGYTENSLFIKCEVNGVTINAYSEPVCLALLEYYAFDAAKKEAQNAFRTLARTTFRAFVYKAVGYTPETKILQSWRQYLDRVDCLENKVPSGYFCVFSEIAPVIVPLIKSGLIINDKVIPDISVGQLWARHWKSKNYDEKIGKRIVFEHNYPPYFRQAASNPQHPYAYPIAALGIFRAWLTNYVERQFPRYLTDKVKQGMADAQGVNLFLENFAKNKLPK